MTTITALLSSIRDRGVSIWVEDGQLRYRGPKGALLPEQMEQLKSRKGELIALLQTRDSTGKRPPLVAPPRPDIVRPTVIQENAWLMARDRQNDGLLNSATAFRLRIPLDLDVLRKTYAAILERHEILRMRFVPIDGRPVLKSDGGDSLSLELRDLRHMPEAEREAAARAIADRFVYRPFDYVLEPLARLQAITIADDDHVLVFVMNHLVSDGWSFAVLRSDFETLYTAFSEGRSSPLAPLKLQFADYAVWQRNWLQGPGHDDQIAYWREQYSAPLLELPADREKKSPDDILMGMTHFSLSPELFARLREFSGRDNATLFTIAVAAFKLVVAKWTGAEDMTALICWADRSHADLHNLIGLILAITPVRTRLTGNPSLREAVSRVRDSTLRGFDYFDIPLDEQAVLRTEIGLPDWPIKLYVNHLNADAMGSLRNLPMTARNDGSIAGFDLPGRQAKFPWELGLAIYESKDHMYLTIMYQESLFSPALVDRLVERFQATFAAIADNPDCRLADLA